MTERTEEGTAKTRSAVEGAGRGKMGRHDGEGEEQRVGKRQVGCALRCALVRRRGSNFKNLDLIYSTGSIMLFRKKSK